MTSDAGRRPATMADVAKLARVSTMTVSRALRNDSSMRRETRDAVLKAAEELNYVLDSTAASFRLQKTNFVAVTVPSINNANFADTVRALSEGLSQQDIQILLGSTNYNAEEEERLIEQLLRRKPEAMVVTGGNHTDRARRLLENAGIPVVETWDLPANPINHVVGFSNAGAVAEMADYFVAVGYRRIAFIGGDTAGDQRGWERRQGFVSALSAHGIDATRLIAAGPPPISMREGADAMSQLLERYPDTEAVICVSDLSAFGALTECQRRGISVPEQMGIGGFGNYEIGRISVPTLTTINAFASEIGNEAARLILQARDGRLSLDNPRTVKIRPDLIRRQSSR